MSLSEQDWTQEEQRVHKVTEKIGVHMERLEAEVGLVRSDVVSIRKHFWDEVTVDFSTTDGAVETIASLKQQAEMLSERERSHRHSSAALMKLKRLYRTPYFGRIDFVERGERREEAIYLGIASFLDEDTGDYLVYDWRAPISSLYYDYGPGEAVYETPNGTVTGDMLLKRQYVIRDGHIHYMFDTGLTIGDELLKQVLSRSSDAQMKTIVATIQKEQNRIIRNDYSRMLIVQGAAGSGKTSAALQRVAFLLYKHRETLQADQMLLFSPNPLFNSYVATVLPELGEDNMQQTTFQAYLEHRLGDSFEVEDSFAQLEYVLTGSESEDADYTARMSGIAYKSSVQFLHTVQSYKQRLERAGMLFKPIVMGEKEIVSEARLHERFYAYDAAIRLPNRLELMRGWLKDLLDDFAELEKHEGWVEDEIELLSSEDYHRAYRQLRRMQGGRGATFDDFDKERDLLAGFVVRERLRPVRADIERLAFVDMAGLYRQLFSDISADSPQPLHWPAICEQTHCALAAGKLLYEDATPFLYLMEAVQGFHTNNAVRHVIVDEAQDYTPFQMEVLKRLFPRCRMTALGDLNQAIYAHASAYSDIDPIADLYGPEQTEVIRLHRSYRSTREIVEFTRGIVPGGDAIEPFTRSGAKPRVVRVSDRGSLHSRIAAETERLLREGYASVAIIAKTASESTLAYEALKPLMSAPLRLMNPSSPELAQGPLVIPSYLAKGVEFDAVLIYDGSGGQYGRESERKLFYTACTRAMHELCIFTLGEPSPFVLAQPSDSYDFDSSPA
ncbi:RNA polymerase recycling motor HelD [Paenibacillus aestuarii]|uniref:RNA polymerase recycling motor HelD n=1 Tax=Paenibacillus aestuarii TaxID=516965 RepID=A0ABW0KBM4_9BACL|nr:RNA polymerase recycling motor HelD [Paenibacillus aestuarii]